MTVSTLDETRSRFHSIQGKLKHAKTIREVEIIREELERAKKDLWDIDPEFRARIGENIRRGNEIQEERGSESRTAPYISRAKAKAQAIKRKFENESKGSRRTYSDRVLQEQTPEKIVKLRTYTEAEEQSKTKLVCPICHDKDRGNIVKDDPVCLKCMHRLVPEDELKIYNRSYRRGWKNRGPIFFKSK